MNFGYKLELRNFDGKITFALVEELQDTETIIAICSGEAFNKIVEGLIKYSAEHNATMEFLRSIPISHVIADTLPVCVVKIAMPSS